MMPMLKLLLTIILLAGSTLTFAQQTGTIDGTVKTSDGQPAIAITISLSGITKGTITDGQGSFSITRIKAGSYTVKASAVGLISQKQNVTVVAGQTITLNLMLTENANQLNEVTIRSGRMKFGDKQSETVARMPLANLENPQVYSVISSALMKEQNIVDYKTAMRNAPGTSTIAQAGNGRAYTFMRGFITGNWVRNGLAAYQFSAIDPANIDRIEVIKGPSGTLFSNSVISYGGLINRVTKKPMDNAFAELSYTGGSFGLHRITADVNTPLNESKSVLFRVNAAYHRAGNFQDAGFERNFFVSPSLTYKVNDKLNFNIETELYQRHTGSINGFNIADPTAWAGKSIKDIPLDYKRSYQGNDIDTKLTNYNAYLQANYQISKQWKSTTLFTFNGVFAPHQMFLDKTILSPTEMQRSVFLLSDKYHQTEVQQNFNGDIYTGSIRHRLLVGVDYLAYRQDPYFFVSANYDVIDYTKPGNFFVNRADFDKKISPLKRSPSDQNIYNTAGYVADVINFTGRLNVMASIRVDHYTDKGFHDINADTYSGAFSQTNWSPKFGAIYQIVKGRLSAFANYQNGFSYNGGKDQNGQLFKPEQAFQYEGGLKLETADGRLSSTLSYYNIKVKDKLRTDPGNNLFTIQDGTQRSRGIEADVVASPITGLNLVAGYAYNDNVYTQAEADIVGNRPYGAPKHLINAWISYALQRGTLKGLGIGAGGNYSSAAFGDDTDLLIVPSYKLFSATAFYDQPKYRIGLKLDNITNERYWGPFIQPQALRSASLNFTYKFGSR